MSEPTQIIAGMSGVWPVHRGKITLSQQFYERSLEQPVKGGCLKCGASFIGLFGDERDWFKTHVCVSA